MNNLSLVTCEQVTDIHWPDVGPEYNKLSPAVDFMTDFNLHMPRVIDANVSALDAEQAMKSSHVKLKLVLDEEQQFAGVLSLSDLYHRRIVKRVTKDTSIDEVMISDLMRSKNQLTALCYEQFQTASIKLVLNALADYDEQHILLLESDNKVLRGLLSASDVVRKLRLSLDVQQSVTFKQIAEYINSQN